MRWMLMTLLATAWLSSPTFASDFREATLAVKTCDAQSVTHTVGSWLAAQSAGSQLSLVRAPNLRGRPSAARLRVRVLNSALDRQVVPVEVQVLREGASPEALTLTWRRSGAESALSTPVPGSPSGTRGESVTLVSRLGSVEVETPGRIVSSPGPDGSVRVVNPKTGRLLQGKFLESGRVLIQGRLTR